MSNATLSGAFDARDCLALSNSSCAVAEAVLIVPPLPTWGSTAHLLNRRTGLTSVMRVVVSLSFLSLMLRIAEMGLGRLNILQTTCSKSCTAPLSF